MTDKSTGIKVESTHSQVIYHGTFQHVYIVSHYTYSIRIIRRHRIRSTENIIHSYIRIDLFEINS